jgi:regulator of telomere elongation helicase 1
LLSEADLVFMPYNYLLDKKTRGSSLLSFKDAIVIFDEAHNVESSCYEAVSCEISSDDLNLSEKELAHCLELIDSPFFISSMSAFGGVSKDTVIAAQRFVTTLKENLSKFVIPQGTNFLSESGDAIFRVFEDGQQLTNGSDRVEIDVMLGSFEEIVKLYLEDQYNRRSGKRSAFQTLVSALRTIYGMAEKEDEECAANDPSTCYTKILDRTQKRRDLIEKSKSFYRMVISEPAPISHGKQFVNTAISSTENVRTMAYWCFNPGVVMKDLISMGVRSIVLTSGTLSPMKSFMQEMQM